MMYITILVGVTPGQASEEKKRDSTDLKGQRPPNLPKAADGYQIGKSNCYIYRGREFMWIQKGHGTHNNCRHPILKVRQKFGSTTNLLITFNRVSRFTRAPRVARQISNT